MNIQYDKSKIESTLKETSIDDSDLSNVVYLVWRIRIPQKILMRYQNR